MSISEKAANVELCNEQLKRMSDLFSCKSVDEFEVGEEKRLMFIEIGGPMAHVKLYSFTREEQSLIKDTLNGLIESRLAKNKELLKQECKKEFGLV